MKRLTSIAAFIVVFSAAAAAQRPAVDVAARQDAVVKQAMRAYQQGLSDLKESESLLQPVTNPDALRELRLEEAVSLALEKNLDIQVAKLEPQSVDFLVAGFRNQFLPVLSSQVGQREQFQLQIGRAHV